MAFRLRYLSRADKTRIYNKFPISPPPELHSSSVCQSLVLSVCFSLTCSLSFYMLSLTQSFSLSILLNARYRQKEIHLDDSIWQDHHGEIERLTFSAIHIKSACAKCTLHMCNVCVAMNGQFSLCMETRELNIKHIGECIRVNIMNMIDRTQFNQFKTSLLLLLPDGLREKFHFIVFY